MDDLSLMVIDGNVDTIGNKKKFAGWVLYNNFALKNYIKKQQIRRLKTIKRMRNLLFKMKKYFFELKEGFDCPD